MRTILGALALMLAAAVPAAAQHGEHMAAMRPGAHAALMHRQELGLSADQVQRLTALDSAFARTMREHCAQVRAAGGPSAQTHAALHPQMAAAMEQSRRQVEAVLTAPQAARLDSIHAAHHGAMAGHDMAAMHHDSAAMAAMHARMHGGSAAPACSANGACSAAECDACCAHMGCCTAPATAAER